MKRVCIFGLGEAGTLFAADLLAAGFEVRGYDPGPVATPAGVERCDSPGSAVADVEAVLALTASADAELALSQALEDIPADALYVDYSSGSPGLKRRLAELAEQRVIAFADIALLAVVPGNGLYTPSAVSGPGAERYVGRFAPLGVPVESVGSVPGQAATRKLLRSIFMKGMAAVAIEALRAAEQAELGDWLWDNIANEIAGADARLLRRLITGTALHADRRVDEMQASADLLCELNIEPLMTAATIANLKSVQVNGLPTVPSA